MRAAAIFAAAAGAAAMLAPLSTVPASCDGVPNNNTIAFPTPTLVAKVANGVRLAAAGTAPNNTLAVVHVYGTSYQMGLAYGQLLAKEINQLIPQAMAYFEAQVNQSIPDWIPEPYREAILTYGLDFAMNLTYQFTRNFTPSYHYDLLQGIADGSGQSGWEITKMALIPELTKAACSIVLAWGSATRNGDLLHLRALDWDTDGPFQQWPVLATFHPTDGGVPYTTLSWAGFYGTITGMSSSGMGAGEKVWLEYAGVENVFGYVWTFLLQDILRFDADMDAALSRIATANRTCSIWVSLSDRNNNLGKVVQYSNQEVNIFNPVNFPTYASHDRFANAMFVNKHVQPSGEPCMNDLMHAAYGTIDAAALVQIAAVEATGDMHAAIYEWSNPPHMYVTNAATPDASGNVVYGYQRQWLGFDMSVMWNTTMADW